MVELSTDETKPTISDPNDLNFPMNRTVTEVAAGLNLLQLP